MTWSKEADEWNGKDESNDFPDVQELPNWALKALKSAPEKVFSSKEILDLLKTFYVSSEFLLFKRIST